MHIHSQGSLTTVNCLYYTQHCIHKGEKEMCLNLYIFFLQRYTKLFPYFWWTKNFPHANSYNTAWGKCFESAEIIQVRIHFGQDNSLMYWSWPYLWSFFSKKLLWYRHCFCSILKLSIGVKSQTIREQRNSLPHRFQIHQGICLHYHYSCKESIFLSWYDKILLGIPAMRKKVFPMHM